MAGSSQLDSFDDEEAVNETLAQLLMVMEALDARIGPMLEEDGDNFNQRWGYLSRWGGAGAGLGAEGATLLLHGAWRCVAGALAVLGGHLPGAGGPAARGQRLHPAPARPPAGRA
jgi:hypothetical protein